MKKEKFFKISNLEMQQYQNYNRIPQLETVPHCGCLMNMPAFPLHGVNTSGISEVCSRVGGPASKH